MNDYGMFDTEEKSLAPEDYLIYGPNGHIIMGS